MNKVVITHALRTAIGSFNGQLSSFSAPQLGSFVIKGLMDAAGVPKDSIDEVILGDVLAAGIGQAPARQAALFAGLPESVECLTINKMCGSGLKSVMLAHQAILAGDANIVIAGGQESMSNSPYLLPKGRNGYKYGHGQLLDSMVHDGLWDAYNNIHMGSCAESCAKEFSFSRADVDSYAVLSYKRALAAQQNEIFTDEIVPVTIKGRSGDVSFLKDEDPEKVNFDKISSLKPAFEKDGVVTAANASNINDGAAAVLMMNEDTANRLGLKPMAEIVAQASAAKKPIEFTTAPADAIQKVLGKAKMSIEEINLFEINEAFAVVSLAVNKILGLNPDKVNVNGGAIALGHPIGASGARILTTLLHQMQRVGCEYGLASLCIGGGEASALIVKKYS